MAMFGIGSVEGAPPVAFTHGGVGGAAVVAGLERTLAGPDVEAVVPASETPEALGQVMLDCCGGHAGLAAAVDATRKLQELRDQGR